MSAVKIVNAIFMIIMSVFEVVVDIIIEVILVVKIANVLLSQAWVDGIELFEGSKDNPYKPK